MQLVNRHMTIDDIVNLRYERRKLSFNYQVGDTVVYDPINARGLSQSWTRRIGKHGTIVKLDAVSTNRGHQGQKRWYIEFEHEIGIHVTPSVDNYVIVHRKDADWEI
ncbi:MAG: hypothetical protein ACW99G_04970 [Candidatus Thorarchaeota archaeon]|jgi:hypothetical protein